MKFRDNQSIMNILDDVYGIGINTFMCTTHDRIADVADQVRSNDHKYNKFKFYPCMPYAHKYANAVTDYGILGSLQRFVPGNFLGSIAKGGIAAAKMDFVSLMQLLVDAEMKMFQGLKTEVIFLQNVVTDLLLGLGFYDFFKEFSEYVSKKFDAEAGFITMNMPKLFNVLENLGIQDPIICSSINKIGFRMCGGIKMYEQFIEEKKFRPIAMQVLAAGAIPPKEAIEYVCSLKNVQSILFGASTYSHIVQTKELIESMSVA